MALATGSTSVAGWSWCNEDPQITPAASAGYPKLDWLAEAVAEPAQGPRPALCPAWRAWASQTLPSRPQAPAFLGGA